MNCVFCDILNTLLLHCKFKKRFKNEYRKLIWQFVCVENVIYDITIVWVNLKFKSLKNHWPDFMRVLEFSLILFVL